MTAAAYGSPFFISIYPQEIQKHPLPTSVCFRRFNIGRGCLPCYGIIILLSVFTNSFYFALFLSYTTTPAIPANAAARIIIYMNIPKLSPVETDESGVQLSPVSLLYLVSLLYPVSHYFLDFQVLTVLYRFLNPLLRILQHMG